MLPCAWPPLRTPTSYASPVQGSGGARCGALHRPVLSTPSWLAARLPLPCCAPAAGAVEQLKTHCGRLKVPLYERGYEKDPAKVGLCRCAPSTQTSVTTLAAVAAASMLQQPDCKEACAQGCVRTCLCHGGGKGVAQSAFPPRWQQPCMLTGRACAFVVGMRLVYAGGQRGHQASRAQWAARGAGGHGGPHAGAPLKAIVPTLSDPLRLAIADTLCPE